MSKDRKNREMVSGHNFRELKIWKGSMDLARLIFEATSLLPEKERFGLISQLNRAAVSVPSNIAEGSARNSSKHFNQYLETSLGSLFEIETQLILAFEFGYIKELKQKNIVDKTQELQKMIHGFQKSLKS